MGIRSYLAIYNALEALVKGWNLPWDKTINSIYNTN